MSLFKSLFSPTYRDLVRWRYAGLMFLGLMICVIADNFLALTAWWLGWVYGMEWQRVKTADGLANKGENE